MLVTTITIPSEYTAFARIAHEAISGLHGPILIAIDGNRAEVDTKWGRIGFAIPARFAEIAAGKSFVMNDMTVHFLKPLLSISMGAGRVNLPDFHVSTNRVVDPIGYRVDAVVGGFLIHLRGRITGMPLTVKVAIPERD
jgi:hypothetical protein